MKFSQKNAKTGLGFTKSLPFFYRFAFCGALFIHKPLIPAVISSLLSIDCHKVYYNRIIGCVNIIFRAKAMLNH